MPIYTVSFIISGKIEIEAETSAEAYDTVRSWTPSTMIDLAESMFVELALPEPCDVKYQ